MAVLTIYSKMMGGLFEQRDTFALGISLVSFLLRANRFTSSSSQDFLKI